MGDWGTAVSSAGEGASSAGSALANTGSMAGTVGNGFSYAANAMPELAGTAGETAGSVGPTIANAAAYTPSMWEQFLNGVDEFSKGGNQGFGSAMRNFGPNLKTAGYLSDKLSRLASMGGRGGASAQPSPINIVYQQPEDRYKRRY